MKKSVAAVFLLLLWALCPAGTAQAQDSAAGGRTQAETLGEIRESLRLLQERQADIGADMSALADQIRKLRGDMEAIGGSPEQFQKDRQEIRDRLDDLSARLRVLENLSGTASAGPPAKDTAAAPAPAQPSAPPKEGKPDLKEAYFDAFHEYKSGRYEQAREKFEAFLKQFPDASLASGARFWIGESHYVQGNIEKAILEYETVIRTYPKGEMVPHALLKQGLSFLKLGDKTGARIVLEKLVANYPDSHQAGIAKSTLAGFK